MITYSQLYTFIALNLIIAAGLFLLSVTVKKANGIGMFLLGICWCAFSWYFQLRMEGHLPADLHSNHIFLQWFVNIVYGFGCWLSIILVFIFGVAGISALLSPDVKAGNKNARNRQKEFPGMPSGTGRSVRPDRSLWPLWIVGIIAGLLSAVILNAYMSPALSGIMYNLTYLIYVRLFHQVTAFPAYYLPAAGIAAGTLVTAIFSRAYRRSAAPAACFFSMLLVPLFTAVLAPLVDLAGSIMVLLLVVSGIVLKNSTPDVSQRPAWPFILLSLGIGVLSGLYFYTCGVTFDDIGKTMTIVGGIASGITTACLGYRSYSCENSKFRALFFLGLVPFCTPGFSYGIAFVICLAAAFLFLVISPRIIKGYPPEQPTNMRTSWGDPVYATGYGNITFSENGQTVDAEESSPGSGVYYTMDGREYLSSGNNLYRG